MFNTEKCNYKIKQRRRMNLAKNINVSTYINVRFYTKKLRGLVRQQTIPTERPPLVGEVSAFVF
jgi:hypothetical protein